LENILPATEQSNISPFTFLKPALDIFKNYKDSQHWHTKANIGQKSANYVNPNLEAMR